MNAESEMDVSIVLPCYQEETSIELGIKAIVEVMEPTAKKFELIFVDDGSKDKTREKIITACERYPNARYILLDQNAGRGNAFLCGAKIAYGKYVGFLDIDLEVSIGALPKVIAELDAGMDVVLVNRLFVNNWGLSVLLRRLASTLYKRLVRSLLRIPSLDTETGFKFFKRETLASLAEMVESNGWFFDTEIISLAYYNKFRIAQVDGMYTKNHKKISTVNLFSDSLSQFRKVWSYRGKLKKLYPT